MIIDPIYIGCDIAKRHLDLYDSGTHRLARIANDPGAIAEMVGRLGDRPVFMVFEATGAYDRALRHALAKADIAYARVNPMRAKRFAEASGRMAKTDARMLAEYGERFTPQRDPAPTRPPSASPPCTGVAINSSPSAPKSASGPRTQPLWRSPKATRTPSPG